MTHVPVLAADHRELRVATQPGERFGDRVMACPTLPIEFRRIQNAFPILFERNIETGQFSALALMGFEDGENLFLEDDRWTARYRPLVMAIQPFLIGRARDAEAPSQIHINMDHPRVGDAEGVRLFDDAGQPTPYLDRIGDMLNQLLVGSAESEAFFAALDRYDLLEPFALDISLDDGTQHRLVGYHLINEDRLRDLEPGIVAELHRDGHLMPIFMAVASLANMTDLIARRNRIGRHG